ncbi:MAG: hypothetical protein ABIJ47_07715 [Candidatus Bathyarchaeota archaeon]
MDEIPLDVCRLCIDAWKTSAEIQVLTGSQMMPQAITIQRPSTAVQTTMQPIVQSMAPEPKHKPPTFELPKISTDEMNNEHLKRLHELDAMFINDNIDAEEYVAQRRAIVSQLSNIKRIDVPSDGYTTISLNDDLEISYDPDTDPFKKLLPLVIIERKRLGFDMTSYPRDAKLPPGLSSKKIQSIYNLYDSLNENESVLLQFNGTRLGLLGKKKNRILCVVLETDENMEDYREEINHLVGLFNQAETVEDLIKALPHAWTTQTFSHQLP